MNLWMMLPLTCLFMFVFSINRANKLREIGYNQRLGGADFRQVSQEQEPKYLFWEKTGRISMLLFLIAVAVIIASRH